MTLPPSMPSKKLHIQLYADECFPLPSVIYLKSLGYSVVHAYDFKFIKKSDPFHLKQSQKLNKILITLDRDFIYYEKVTLDNHPGVIVLSTGSATPISVNKVCEKFLKSINDNSIKDSLLKVTMDQIVKIKNGKVVYKRKY